MIKVHDVTQGSVLWQTLRSNNYTGSGAEKLLKHSNSKKIIDGVLSTYAETTPSGFGGNFSTKRGHVLEDEAIDLYERIRTIKTGRPIKVDRPGFITNSRYEKCGVSPDGFEPSDRILIEVKCFNEANHMALYNAQDELELPLKITAQIYFGLVIWELTTAHLVIYNPDIDDSRKAFKIIEITLTDSIKQTFDSILLPKEVA